MTVNQEARQAAIAADVEQAARILAHSTRSVPKPWQSYSMLGELHEITSHLSQVARQLASWHGRVTDGVEYQGEDERGDGATGTVSAAANLEDAAAALDAATTALMKAHSANGVIRWNQ